MMTVPSSLIVVVMMVVEPSALIMVLFAVTSPPPLIKPISSFEKTSKAKLSQRNRIKFILGSVFSEPLIKFGCQSFARCAY